MKSSQGLVLQQHPSSLPHPRNSARPSGFTPSGGTFQRPCLRAVPADLSARKGSAVYKSLLDWGFVAVIPSRRENRIPAVTFSLTALPPRCGLPGFGGGVVWASTVPRCQRAQHPCARPSDSPALQETRLDDNLSHRQETGGGSGRLPPPRRRAGALWRRGHRESRVLVSHACGPQLQGEILSPTSTSRLPT